MSDFNKMQEDRKYLNILHEHNKIQIKETV